MIISFALLPFFVAIMFLRIEHGLYFVFMLNSASMSLFSFCHFSIFLHDSVSMRQQGVLSIAFVNDWSQTMSGLVRIYACSFPVLPIIEYFLNGYASNVSCVQE